MADIPQVRTPTGKIVLAHLMLAGSAAVVLLLGWYLAVLLGRMSVTGYGTSIGFDVLLGFHLLGFAAVVASSLALRLARVRYGWAILLAGLLVELSFLGLNLAGRVREYRKAEAGDPLRTTGAYEAEIAKSLSTPARPALSKRRSATAIIAS